MKGWIALVFVSGIGCKDKCPPPTQSPAAAPAKPAQAKQDDPWFVRVDADQLAALCVAKRLPPGSYPSDYGALAVPGGTRVPWLTMWIDEEDATIERKLFVPIKEWKARAVEVIKQFTSDPPSPAKRTPGRIEWINELCGEDAADVAITGVFFQKDGFYALAMRGSQAREDKLPVKTPREAVFRRAFELTDELLGGKHATIATHTLAGSELATVTTDVWVKAAKP